MSFVSKLLAGIITVLYLFFHVSCNKCDNGNCDEEMNLEVHDSTITGLWYRSYHTQFNVDNEGDTMFTEFSPDNSFYEILNDSMFKKFTLFPDEFDLLTLYYTEDSLYTFEIETGTIDFAFRYQLLSNTSMIWDQSFIHPLTQSILNYRSFLTKFYTETDGR
jgi:hypothetical protein